MSASMAVSTKPTQITQSLSTASKHAKYGNVKATKDVLKGMGTSSDSETLSQSKEILQLALANGIKLMMKKACQASEMGNLKATLEAVNTVYDYAGQSTTHVNKLPSRIERAKMDELISDASAIAVSKNIYKALDCSLKGDHEGAIHSLNKIDENLTVRELSTSLQLPLTQQQEAGIVLCNHLIQNGKIINGISKMLISAESEDPNLIISAVKEINAHVANKLLQEENLYATHIELGKLALSNAADKLLLTAHKSFSAGNPEQATEALNRLSELFSDDVSGLVFKPELTAEQKTLHSSLVQIQHDPSSLDVNSVAIPEKSPEDKYRKIMEYVPSLSESGAVTLTATLLKLAENYPSEDHKTVSEDLLNTAHSRFITGRINFAIQSASNGNVIMSHKFLSAAREHSKTSGVAITPDQQEQMTTKISEAFLTSSHDHLALAAQAADAGDIEMTRSFLSKAFQSRNMVNEITLSEDEIKIIAQARDVANHNGINSYIFDTIPQAAEHGDIYYVNQQIKKVFLHAQESGITLDEVQLNSLDQSVYNAFGYARAQMGNLALQTVHTSKDLKSILAGLTPLVEFARENGNLTKHDLIEPLIKLSHQIFKDHLTVHGLTGV